MTRRSINGRSIANTFDERSSGKAVALGASAMSAAATVQAHFQQMADQSARVRQMQEVEQRMQKPSIVNRSPVIQRFTVVKPTDYQAAGLNQGQMFPSQQLDRSRSSTINGHELIEQNLKWVNRYAVNPALKVSQSGKLALESTVGQPKVFYGTAEDIAKNRQRLIDIGSRVTLKAVGSTTLQVPKNPALIGPQSNTLVPVVPEGSPEVEGAKDYLMNANECDSVSNAIVNGKEMVIGNRRDGFETIGSVSVRGGEIEQVAKTAKEHLSTDSISDFAKNYKANRDNIPDLYDNTIPISTEVADYFANGYFRRKHLVPEAQILRALSLPGIPKELWAQVYELHVGKTERQRPFRATVMNHIKNVMKVRAVAEYNPKRTDNHLNARLGINEHASPEVGESFSTMAQTSAMVADKDGVLSHELSFTSLSDPSIDSALKGMLALSKSEEMLGILAQDQFKRAKGVVPFQEHHAAVVAKDGDDTITFENYNRNVEADTLKTDLWDSLFEEFSLFDRNIKKEIQDIRKAIATAKSSTTKGPIEKYFDILRQKKAHLELLREKFLTVSNYVGLKLNTNLDEDKDSLWHFNMYGPVRATFIDENGKAKRQSFHDTWSPAIPNAITVRTTSLADQFFKNASIDKIKTRIGQVAFHAVKTGKFAHSADIVDKLFNIIVDPITKAKTRIEVADALQAARARLEKLETFPDLEGDEARQAELLVNKKYLDIKTEAIHLLQQARSEQQKVQFNGAMALKLQTSHPDLSAKYLLWQQQAQEKATLLEAKARFFRAVGSRG